jgi:hypothetical protein
MGIDQDAKTRLARARKLIGKNPAKIDSVLREVLKGTKDHARWVFLFNDLSRRLRSSLGVKKVSSGTPSPQ